MVRAQSDQPPYNMDVRNAVEADKQTPKQTLVIIRLEERAVPVDAVEASGKVSVLFWCLCESFLSFLCLLKVRSVYFQKTWHVKYRK